jgi:hypothetical protein
MRLRRKKNKNIDMYRGTYYIPKLLNDAVDEKCNLVRNNKSNLIEEFFMNWVYKK